METPEKIYVHVKKDKVTNTWNSTWVGVHDIEYIRKDAFIEKTVSYLNSKFYDWIRIEHPNPSVSSELIIKQDFIEDFKNYIKGE